MSCRNADARPYDCELCIWQGYGCDDFSDALHESSLSEDKKRDVGSQLFPQSHQLLSGEMEIKQSVEADQGGGCIGTSATHASACRDAFGDMNADSRSNVELSFQEAGCSDAKVVIEIPDEITATLNAVFIQWEQVDGVVQIDERKDGFQQMLPVGTSSDDMQKKV